MSELSADHLRVAMMMRIGSGNPFTFADLHDGFAEKSAYRIADRLIQKLRKSGHIKMERIGRRCVWSLTDKSK